MELFPSLYHEQPSTFKFAIREITTQLENPSSSVHPAAVPDQLLVKFVLRTHYKYTKISSDNTETTDREFDRFRERSFQFDMDVLKNYHEAQEVISGMLGLFGVRRGDPLNQNMARRIIRAGLEIGDKVSRPMLGLCVDMKRQRFGVRFEMTRNQRTELMRRMMMELDEMEAELSEMLTRNDDPNTGMVPASESSISKALKRVRVGGDHGEESDGGESTKRRRIGVSESESCTICMEEFKGGSSSEEAVVVSMPCEHVFHDECIVKWLKQSHYCPVCRFQVSTTTESGSLDTRTL